LTELIKCACGCGQIRPKYDRYGIARRFIRGHHRRKPPPEENSLISCACGCGQIRPKYDRYGIARRFILGHHNRRPPPAENSLISCACGCGQSLLKYDSRWRPRKYIRGHNASRWKGGRYIQEDGYVMIFSPEHPRKNSSNYIYEHRLTMEQNLGRLLTLEESIHHINGNKSDNGIENLLLFPSNREHMIWERNQSGNIWERM